MKSIGRTLLLYSLWGFGFGVVNNIAYYCFFDIAPEGMLVHQVQVVLLTINYPASHFALLCLPDGNIYVFIAASIVMVLLQWTLIGLAIGYWRYRVLLKKGSL